MSRPQGYMEGEVFESRRVQSGGRWKVTAEKLALLALCLLVASALVVSYLLSELVKTRETIRNLEVKLETVKSVTERLPEIQPCPTVQPTRPPQPEVKTNTETISTVQPTSPSPPEVTNEPCDKCDEGWEEHGGKCYYFSISKASWNESRAHCRAEGGDLVKIDSVEEQSFLMNTVEHKNGSFPDMFWIGLTDSAAEGSWLWVDGSALNHSLAFWYFTQPDDWKGEDPDGEDCATMGPTMFDISCKLPHKCICEKAVCVSDHPEGSLLDTFQKSLENIGNIFKMFKTFNL